MLKAIGSKEVISSLWAITKELILERLTRKIRKKRTSIASSKLLEWVEGMDPEMVLSDIPEYSRSRIEDMEDLLR